METERSESAPQLKRDQLLKEIERNGLRLDDFGSHIRVHGKGIDILAVRLEDIGLSEIRPMVWRPRR